MNWPLQLTRLLCCVLLSIGGVSNAADCNLNKPTAAFGSYDPFSSVSQDTIGTIKVTCTGSIGEAISYSISADWILQGGSRTATNGKTPLSYALYIDSGYAQAFGNGSGGSFVVSDSYRMGGSTSTHSYYIYGRIPARQTSASMGAYSSTITLTLTY